MPDQTDLRLAMAQMRHRRAMPRWAWWLISALPLMFMLLGIGLVADAVRFKSSAESARGRVVDVQVSTDSEGGASYTPLIEYTRSDGRRLRGETHISSGNYDYRIGEQVDILYAFDDPGEVRIDSFFSLYGLGLIFAAVGAVFLVIARAARRAMARPGSPLTAREMREQEASERRRREDEAHAKMLRAGKPRTTDPSQYGHVHEPKPKREPTVRRMR